MLEGWRFQRKMTQRSEVLQVKPVRLTSDWAEGVKCPSTENRMCRGIDGTQTGEVRPECGTGSRAWRCIG
jgi:hypothetical protein